MRTYSRLVLLLVAIALSLLAACTSKTYSRTLTRANAAEIISKQFPIQMTFNMAIGRTSPGESSMERYLQTPDGQVHKLWQDDGLISLEWQSIAGPPRRMMKPAMLIGLTKKGESYDAGSPKAGVAAIRMCEQQFDHVTGIEMGKNNTAAKVEYTWKLGNLTPFGKRQTEVLGQASLCGNLAPQPDSVSLRLDDDGWRIAQ